MSGRLTAAGLNRILTSGLLQAAFPYLIVGKGTQTFSEALTTLNDEVLGKATTLKGADNLAALLGYFTNSEANYTLTEVALRSGISSGTLYGYDTLEVAIEKDATRPVLLTWLQTIQNTKGDSFFTAYGLRAIRQGGVTTSSLPYIGVGAGTKTFHEWMTDPGTVIARKATTVNLSGVDATISANFGTSEGNGTWEAFTLWDAATDGNLLAYVKLGTAYTKTSAAAKTAQIAFKIENEA